jgi:hypothetical protein
LVALRVTLGACRSGGGGVGTVTGAVTVVGGQAPHPVSSLPAPINRPEVVALQTAVMAQLSEPQRRQLVRLLATVRDGLDDLDVDAVLGAAPRRGTSSST